MSKLESSKNLPRDTFLYLLATITLIIVSFGFGLAVFNYINFYFPDSATDFDFYARESSYEFPIRQAMAMLIVVFPVFVWVSRFLKKDIYLHPEKKELKIRKWLLSLTLFVAGLVIIGDLIAVINNFLSGELTTRFILKALTIVFIAGSIFYYYLAQIKEEKVKWLSIFSWLIIGVVIFVVSWGFVIIGSPLEQREKRFDEKRIQHLQMIQNYIINYWQSKKMLPEKLVDLENPLLNIFIPVDPKTSQPYEYRIIKNKTLTFELCANFAGTNNAKEFNYPVDQTYPGLKGINDNWRHSSGRTCFERSIDPDFFEIKTKPF
jgi:hypothetical protein